MSRKKHRLRRHRHGEHSSEEKAENAQSAAAWYWYALVIVGALVLFGVFIGSQFAAIDRPLMVVGSIICAGIAFLIIGTCTAVGNFDFSQHPIPEKLLSSLAEAAEPKKRPGEIFYSSNASYRVFEKVLMVVVFPLGLFLALVRPKQTWPAILWVAAGLLAVVGTYLGAVMFSSKY